MLKNVLIFVGGAGVGAMVTYLVLNDKYDQMYKADWEKTHAAANQKIKDMEESVRAREQAAMDMALNNLPYGADTITPTENPFPSEAADGVLPVEQPDISDEPEDEIDDYPTEEKRAEPYLITESEFSDENLWYSKEELFYFAQDQVLTDEEEEMVDARTWDLIGSSAIPELENTRDEVFIRNDKAAIDFQIVFCDKSWIETHD